MKTRKRNLKTFLYDVFLNTLAFCIYFFTQQIILLPILAKRMPEASYATFLIYISVVNLLCNSFGSQLGVTKQVNELEKYNDDADYAVMLLILSIISIVISVVFLSIYHYNIIEILLLSLILILCNFRFYVRYLFRIENNYKKIILQNLLF